MTDHRIPLIIRGTIIDDNMVEYGGRHSSSTISTPDVKKYYSQLVLSDPSRMKDLYSISLSDIVDYLDELSVRLTPATNPHIRKAIEISAENCGHSPEMLEFMYDRLSSITARRSASSPPSIWSMRWNRKRP